MQSHAAAHEADQVSGAEERCRVAMMRHWEDIVASENVWLPAPKDADFSLYVRSYWPKVAVTDGSWTPPPVRVAS